MNTISKIWTQRPVRQNIFFKVFLVLTTIFAFCARAKTLNYQYDFMQRLTRLTQSDGTTINYVYDALGNRLMKSIVLPGGPTNHPPNAFTTGSPADGATNVISRPMLSWAAVSDPDPGDQVVYFVYFGTTPSPPLVASGWIASWLPDSLSESTRYYWYVVARDSHNAETASPLWSFQTTGRPLRLNIGNKSAIVSNAMQFSVAPIPANASTSLSVSNAPSGSTFVANGGVGVFTWTPPEKGIYSLTFHAVNPAGADRETIDIWVVDRAAPGLDPGDVAVVRVNNSGTPNDGFSFVALKTLSASNGLFFTDNGWTQTNAFRQSEYPGTLSLLASDIPAGSVVDVDAGKNLSIFGDQVILFTNTLAAPKLLFGLDWGNEAGWDPDATNTYTSADPAATTPPALAAGLSLSLGNSNAYYYAGPMIGLKEMILAAIGNTNNWVAVSASNSPSWDRGSFLLVDNPNPPVLIRIRDKSGYPGQELQFAVRAIPTDGDLVTLSVENPPSGAVFSSTNENGVFTWTPDSIGEYVMVFSAADKDGTNREEVVISVGIPPVMTIDPGGVAIIRVNNNGTTYDSFSFVTLKTLSATNGLFYTDSGWTSSNTFRLTEYTGNVSLITGDIPAGTVVNVNAGTTLSIFGDQVFLYENTPAAPALLFGIDWGNAQGWDPNATNSYTSADPAATSPPALVPGLSLSLGNSNAYTYVGPLFGTRETILAAIATPDNWIAVPASGNDAWERGAFSIGDWDLPPMLIPIGDKTIMVDQDLQFTVRAVPTGGDLVTLSVEALPLGASFSSTYENGVFTWTPGRTGEYALVFSATDKDGVDSVGMNISVVAPPENLYPGAVAVIRVNNNGPSYDSFSFVALAPIPASNALYFTDSGWTITNVFRQTEYSGAVNLITNDIPAGTVVDVNAGTTLSIFGDQVFLYTNTLAAPTLLFGMDWGNAQGWDPNATNSYTSADPAATTPPALATGLTLSLGNSNAYTYAGLRVGTQTELLAAIADPSNWVVVSTSDNNSWTGGVFTIYRPNGDDDNDGIPNWWELQFFDGYTNCIALKDDDFDGMNNLAEYVCGTVPTNALSRLEISGIARYPAGGFLVSFGTESGRLYSLETTTNLGGGQWSNMASRLDGQGAPLMIRDGSDRALQFYRIRVTLGQ